MSTSSLERRDMLLDAFVRIAIKHMSEEELEQRVRETMFNNCEGMTEAELRHQFVVFYFEDYEKLLRDGSIPEVEDDQEEGSYSLYRCQDCLRLWSDREVQTQGNVFPDIPDLLERVRPGEPMPYGTCPKCGALVHRDEDEKHD